MRTSAIHLLVVWVLSVPAVALGGELYSYVDADGVVHFTNVPSDRRFRKVTRTADVGGIYRVSIRGGRNGGAAAPRSGASYLQHLQAAAEKYRLPVPLLRAVMAVESAYNSQAVSEKGAVGLMQLMPRTARDMYVSDIWDPAQNIEGGARYLRTLANLYGGDMLKTLAAYNAGPDAVRRASGGIPDIPETRDYVRKVVALYQDFKAER
jgi:soluble lytic murein transglycosylase-like protein